MEDALKAYSTISAICARSVEEAQMKRLGEISLSTARQFYSLYSLGCLWMVIRFDGFGLTRHNPRASVHEAAREEAGRSATTLPTNNLGTSERRSKCFFLTSSAF